MNRLTDERRQHPGCTPKASIWRAQHRTTSTPPVSDATARLLARPFVTTPYHRIPSRPTIAQSNRSKTQPSSAETQRTRSNPTHNPAPHHLLLQQQRLNRPVAPHLLIYRPQITSVLSVLQRLTGLGLSAAFSLSPIIYLSATHLGLGLDLSADAIAASFGSLPWIVKSAVKFGVAWIFTFHGLNSLRFLAWKFAKGVTNKEVAVSGWVVVVGSVAGAVGLAWYV
jgi:succinate dehydrogenase (ubiquinone) cytochrome b560 subunit